MAEASAGHTRRSVRIIEPGASLKAAVQDLSSGLIGWRVWSAMAQLDLKQRYHRAAIGLFWIFLSFAAFVFVKAVIFNRFAGDLEFPFSVYLAVGFLIWQFMSGVVNDGSDAFVSAGNWLKGMSLPMSTFIYQSLMRQSITLGYSALVLIPLMLYEGHSLQAGALLAIPGLVVLMLTGVWVELLVGTVAARFRDLKHLLQALMRITFFLTPILWVPSAMGRLGDYTYWNPFANFIEIIRMPLLEGRVDPFHWFFVLGVTLVGAPIALLVFTAGRNRIVYWL